MIYKQEQKVMRTQGQFLFCVSHKVMSAPRFKATGNVTSAFLLLVSCFKMSLYNAIKTLVCLILRKQHTFYLNKDFESVELLAWIMKL